MRFAHHQEQSMARMAEKKKSRRGDTSRRPKDPNQAGRKYSYARTVYMQPDEDSLVVSAAEIERRSISAFIAESAIERAHEVIRMENRRRTLAGDASVVPKKKRP